MHEAARRFDAAREIVAAGVALARAMRRQGETRAWLKADGSPATQVDVQIEELLRSRILELFPEDGFVGEESGRKEGTSDYDWCCDPLDGTWALLNGESTVAITAVVSHRGRVVVSVVHNAITDELFCWTEDASSGIRSEYDDSENRPLEQAVVNVRIGRESVADLTAVLGLWTDKRIGKVVVLGGSVAYSMALVARGDHEILCGRIEDGEACDIVAGRTLIVGSGGTVRLTPLARGLGFWLVAGGTVALHDAFADLARGLVPSLRTQRGGAT